MNLLQAIVAHLTNELDVRVATEKPANTKPPFVTVVRNGGGGNEFTDEARISVHCWGRTETEAYELGLLAASAMFQLIAFENNVVSCTQQSFYSNIYTDGTRRWTGVYNIYCNR